MAKLDSYLGSSGYAQLAPVVGSVEYGTDAITVSAVDATAGLTTLISLTGKYAVTYINISDLSTTTTYTFRLTIDGVLIFNSAFTTSGAGTTGNNFEVLNGMAVLANTSLLLEFDASVSGDTSVGATINARLIL